MNQVGLVYYGNHNLQMGPDRWMAETESARDGAPLDVQSVSRARSAGSTVVNSRLTEKTINLTGSIFAEKWDFQESNKRFDAIFNRRGETLRIVPEYTSLFKPALSSSSGTVVSTNEDNINFYDFESATKGIKFDLPGSATTTTITGTTTAQPTDLSAVDLQGNFEFSLYLPDTTGISEIELEISSGILGTNGYSYTFISDYQGRGIRNGINLFSVPWANMTLVGSQFPDSLDVYRIKITRDGTGLSAINGCVWSGLLWVNEERVRNYEVFRSGSIAKSNAPDDADSLNYSASFIAYKGYGESTHAIDVVDLTGQTDALLKFSVDLDGSFTPLPTYEITINSQSDLNNIRLINSTTDERLDITKQYENGDVFLLNNETGETTVNATPIDFQNRLPEHALGQNNISLQFLLDTETVVGSGTGSTSTYFQSGSLAGFAQSFEADQNGVISKLDFYLFARGYSNSYPFSSSIWLAPDSGGDPDIANAVRFTAFNLDGEPFSLRTLTGISFPVTNASTYWFLAPFRPNTIANNGYGTLESLTPYPDGEGRYSFNLFQSTVGSDLNTAATWTTHTNDFWLNATIDPGATIDYDINMSYKKLYV